ncbi:hypothetical protein Tco_1274151 [Tanacetum coccineum]
MLESNAYKTYYAFASGEKTPKPKYVRKKADPDTSPKQKPIQATKRTRLKSKAKVAKSDKKKQPAKKTKAKGLAVLSEVMELHTQVKVSCDQQQNTSGTDEGTSTIPRVLDVPTYESESKKESWGDSDEEDEDVPIQNNKNASQQSGFEQEEEDAYVTLTPVLDTQNTGGHLQIQETKLPFKMAGLLFNKYKGDRVRVILVLELREMLQALGEIMLQVKKGLLIGMEMGQESDQELDEEQLAFLANLRVTVSQETQTIILHNAAFQTDDLGSYDSDCDDISSGKVVLMDNLSSYDSDVLSEMFEKMSNHVTNWDKVNQETKTINESLTAELERYKERVKTFEQRLNVDLSSREKFIDSQMDDMIWNRNALKQEIDSLKQALSKQVKEKELLLQTFTVFKKE